MVRCPGQHQPGRPPKRPPKKMWVSALRSTPTYTTIPNSQNTALVLRPRRLFQPAAVTSFPRCAHIFPAKLLSMFRTPPITQGSCAQSEVWALEQARSPANTSPSWLSDQHHFLRYPAPATSLRHQDRRRCPALGSFLQSGVKSFELMQLEERCPHILQDLAATCCVLVFKGPLGTASCGLVVARLSRAQPSRCLVSQP